MCCELNRFINNVMDYQLSKCNDEEELIAFENFFALAFSCTSSGPTRLRRPSCTARFTAPEACRHSKAPYGCRFTMGRAVQHVRSLSSCPVIRWPQIVNPKGSYPGYPAKVNEYDHKKHASVSHQNSPSQSPTRLKCRHNLPNCIAHLNNMASLRDQKSTE